MKIPAVPPVRPAVLVMPNEVIETWSPISVDASTGLTLAQANSIDGMTLETSRRLTAAVTNLAAFFSSDPEFANIVNMQNDAVTPVTAASTVSASSTATAPAATDPVLDQLAPVHMKQDVPLDRTETSMALPSDPRAISAATSQSDPLVIGVDASPSSAAAPSTPGLQATPTATASASIERTMRQPVPTTVQDAPVAAHELGLSQQSGLDRLSRNVVNVVPDVRGASDASDGMDTNGGSGSSKTAGVSDATRTAGASGTSGASDDSGAAGTFDGTVAPRTSDTTDTKNPSAATDASLATQASDQADATEETVASRTIRTPIATSENVADSMSDENKASGTSNTTRRVGPPGNSDAADSADTFDTFDARNAADSRDANETTGARLTARATDLTKATDTADSTGATETPGADNLKSTTRKFGVSVTAMDETATGLDVAYISSPNKSREADDEPDAVAPNAEPVGNRQDVDRAEDQLLAARSNETQVDEKPREGDSAGSGGGSDDRQDHAAGWNNIEGAAIPTREQGALALVPFNRRLETNGVDQTALLAAEFSAQSHAYGGHDPNNWIVPLTIGAPRMSTDGGASPPSIFAADEELQSGDETQPTLAASPRLTTPLIWILPAAARRRPGLRRRRVRIASLYKRMPWIGARYRVPRLLMDSVLSDPRCIGVVECAACWVVRDSDRREQSHRIAANAPV